ncbi:G patch domain-containing protein 1 homolog [Anopheles ziemanni]|uniref:G patch domain-containing protein 1 homolog n=1 Tax=Anopheles coustani TaxID=139045 RepID=UPI002658E9DB|nr:G patch domain-containing protein 1 homolog [Anopheles coustani]XP_058171666.1 G patch domain-containing protein 1 homolog [Anopheles ziemanni]
MEDEEETLCRYGTALPPFEEDAVPSKRPITVEDQIVLDSNGKRRFHGAFTGGFSAGYWNTVGSEEGWKPKEFKSSRSAKSSTHLQQNAMDFMDEEDLGEFGFAPQRVQAKEDFAHSSSTDKSTKRKLDLSFSKGPIPGQPVLRALLEPAKEKTAVKMLKKMGWREGQGIGERQSKGEKKRTTQRNNKERYVMKTYGCEIPGRSEPPENTHQDDSSDSSDSDYDVTFAPDDFDPLVAALKDNTFGLGYSGLDRGTTKRFNLFDTFEVVDKNNKKLSIRGQAFGIGALEDDDDLDVYARDDMSRYDFSLEDGKQTKSGTPAIKSGQQGASLDGFCPASNIQKLVKKVFRSSMPDSFKPRNWTERRSRFDPLNEERSRKIQQENEYKVRGLGRHDLDPKERGAILGEREIENPILERINAQSSKFVPKDVIDEGTRELMENGEIAKEKDVPVSTVPKGLLNETKVLLNPYLGSTKEGFKPFIAIPDKQDRYERFLTFQPNERYLTREQYLESLQPLNLSAWERERELKEFIQAERMYRPLDGLMSDRFVTASALIADKTISEDGAAEKREVKMKRTRTMWKPHKELCKRFNVPEPFGGMMHDDTETEKRSKEKGKFSVFDYLETPVTNRRDFVTPVILPSTSQPTETKPADVANAGSFGQRLSSKDFFASDESLTLPTGGQKLAEKVSHEPVEKNPTTKANPPKVVKKLSGLEQQVLEATNKKPEEKRDLFKSIFCSSDEESEQQDNETAKQDLKPALTDEQKMQMVDSIVAIKPVQQINILRNNSPPRGIFKSLFEFKKPSGGEQPSLNALTETAKSVPAVDGANETGTHSSASDSESSEDEYYGPSLPTTMVASGSSGDAPQVHLDDRLRHLLGTNDKGGTKGGKQEIWIEKDSDRHSSGRGKKKKKHKEHQKSKSKSKHKKDKKKSSHKHKSRR